MKFISNKNNPDKILKNNKGMSKMSSSNSNSNTINKNNN